MVDALEIEWKVAGLLPIPIKQNSIYYNRNEDKAYANRVFGCHHLNIPTCSLIPTKQFHQALNAELKRYFNLNIGRLPYVIPIDEIGNQLVKLKLRLFESQFLVLSIQLQLKECNLSVSDTIKLQKISSHPILESIARFCFNVNNCPNPSQMTVKGWQCKPLIKIITEAIPLDDASLVEIVTRHQGLDQRSITEMLDKNSSLNFNSDQLLIDKQGVAFLQRSSDKENQRNRFKRISFLFEYAIYVKATDRILSEYKETMGHQLQSNLERINKVLNTDVLMQSVSARRGWELLKIEMNLKTFHLPDIVKETKVPFYKDPIFIAISALVTLFVGILSIFKILNGE